MGSLAFNQGPDLPRVNFMVTYHILYTQPSKMLHTQICKLLCSAIVLSPPAPTGLPQSFIIQRKTRNMTFSWSPLSPAFRNGVITGYFLSCVPEVGGRSSISMQYTTAGTFTLGGFTPATSYNCFVSASNGQGRGPAAYLAIRTLDAREYFHVYEI